MQQSFEQCDLYLRKIFKFYLCYTYGFVALQDFLLSWPYHNYWGPVASLTFSISFRQPPMTLLPLVKPSATFFRKWSKFKMFISSPKLSQEAPQISIFNRGLEARVLCASLMIWPCVLLIVLLQYFGLSFAVKHIGNSLRLHRYL